MSILKYSLAAVACATGISAGTADVCRSGAQWTTIFLSEPPADLPSDYFSGFIVLEAATDKAQPRDIAQPYQAKVFASRSHPELEATAIEIVMYPSTCGPFDEAGDGGFIAGPIVQDAQGGLSVVPMTHSAHMPDPRLPSGYEAGK